MTDPIDRAFAAFQAELLRAPGSTRDALAAAIRAAIGGPVIWVTSADDVKHGARVRSWINAHDHETAVECVPLYAVTLPPAPQARPSQADLDMRDRHGLRWPHGSMGEDA